ncbi:MAG TPA: hypothetical protein VG317_01430 [Pseudonocardiaceae bacterium]|nr:hypothetical protein [Pseudonocardiaceae bacterium]
MSGTGKGSEDEFFDSHPDLANPDWQRDAERSARKGARPPSHRELRRRWEDTYGTTFTTPARRRFRASWLIAGIVVLAMIGTAGLWWRSGEQGANATGGVPVTPAPPASTVTVEQAADLDLNQPFADTPAAGWGDGANGIVPPAPVAVGRWTATQVATAENQVKQVLIAAHLDNRLLVNHDPSAYLALLAPNARTRETQGLADKSSQGDYGNVSLLATGFHLLPAPIKVSGTMAAGLGQNGVLRIHTNYVFAFPFAPAVPAEIQYSWQIVAVQHVQEDFDLPQGRDYAPADRGIWPGNTQSYDAQMDCRTDTQGYLGPAYADEVAGSPVDTENPDALFDPNHPINVPAGCPH